MSIKITKYCDICKEECEPFNHDGGFMLSRHTKGYQDYITVFVTVSVSGTANDQTKDVHVCKKCFIKDLKEWEIKQQGEL